MAHPITITYKSIHHYLVDCRNGKLLVDAGWAVSMPELTHGLGRYGIELSDIKYVMMTHSHPDHAGLTQEVKNACGARLLIHERQIPYLQDLLAFYQRRGGYEPIVVGPDDIVVKSDGSRETLNSIGIDGEIVETPGHSDDSISLVLDSGIAFVGDLRTPDQVDSDSYEVVCDSWRKLLSLNVQTAYPAHAGPIQAKDVEKLLSDSPSGT